MEDDLRRFALHTTDSLKERLEDPAAMLLPMATHRQGFRQKREVVSLLRRAGYGAIAPQSLSEELKGLDRAHVRQREQGRSRVSYLEGWQVFAEANRIFGFDTWQRHTLISRCVSEHERPIGRERKSGWGVTYIARVRICVTAGDRTLIREGSGAGHGIDADCGQAHESAFKEPETDATKRALMAFGLALYDKQQRQVSDANPAAPASRPGPISL